MRGSARLGSTFAPARTNVSARECSPRSWASMPARISSRNRSARLCSSSAGGGAGATGARQPAVVRTRTSASLLALVLLIFPCLHQELNRGTRSRHHRLAQTVRFYTLLDQVLLHGHRALLRIGFAF